MYCLFGQDSDCHAYYLPGLLSFNEDITAWDTSGVMDMSHMFWGAKKFNQPIGGWRVDEVTDMRYMFGEASAFNQPLGGWRVNKVTSMGGMFMESAFNQPIGGWRVDAVTDMRYMFEDASAFNQPIGAWGIDKVTDMSRIFFGASDFDQALGWCVSKKVPISGAFSGTKCVPLSCGVVQGTCPESEAAAGDYCKLSDPKFCSGSHFSFAEVPSNPFDNISEYRYAVPTLADMDGDNETDLLLIGRESGSLAFYRSANSTFQLVVGDEDPFKNITVSGHAAPALVDLDGDGNLDLVVGAADGLLVYYHNDGSMTFRRVTAKEQTTMPCEAYNVSGSNNWVGAHGTYVASGFCAGMTLYKCVDCLWPEFELYHDDGFWWTIGRNGCGSMPIGSLVGRSGFGHPGLYMQWMESTGFVTSTSVECIAAPTASPTLAPTVPVRIDDPFVDINVGAHSAPALADLDDDGLPDLVIGKETAGALTYYKNVGSRRVAKFRAVPDGPFANVIVGSRSKPAFYDLDNDGDQDLIVGDKFGEVLLFLNVGSRYAPDFALVENPFAGIIPVHAAPTLGLLNGVHSLVVGSAPGLMIYSEAPKFEFVTTKVSPFGGINVDSLSRPASRPALVDLDGDGDLDLVVGDNKGKLNYWRNVGTPSQPKFEKVGGCVDELTTTDRNGKDCSYYRVFPPCDGRFDDDDFTASEQCCACGGEKPSSDKSPFEGIGGIGATFADLDGDGLLDLVVTRLTTWSKLSYYRNVGMSSQPKFEKVGGCVDDLTTTGSDGYGCSRYAGESWYCGDFDDIDFTASEQCCACGGGRLADEVSPFAGIDLFGRSHPALADLDNDGDLDLVVGEENGVLKYYRNVGDSSEPRFEGCVDDLTTAGTRSGIDVDCIWYYNLPGDCGDHDDDDFMASEQCCACGGGTPESPFRGIDVGWDSVPTFADVDGDGHLDLVVGEGGFREGRLFYYRNVGTSSQPSFEKVGCVDDLTTTDSDGEDCWWYDPGDSECGQLDDDDFIASEQCCACGGGLRKEESPFADVITGTRSAPFLADLDDDGDLDLVVGDDDGQLNYFQNAGSCRKTGEGGACSGNGICGELNGTKATCECLFTFESDQCDTCRAGNNGTDCQNCPGNTWSKAGVGETCDQCEIGYYRDGDTCDFCGEDKVCETTDVTVNNFECIAGTYRDGSECKSCENGMKCEAQGVTLQNVRLEHNKWRTSENSAVIEDCPLTNACSSPNKTQARRRLISGNYTEEEYDAGENLCAPGYHGPLCAVCKSHHYRSGNECKKCSRGSAALNISLFCVVFVGFIVAVVVSLLLSKNKLKEWSDSYNQSNKKKEKLDGSLQTAKNTACTAWKLIKNKKIQRTLNTAIKQVLGMWSVVSSTPWILDVTYPKIFDKTLAFFNNVFSFDFTIAADCAAEHIGFKDQLLMDTLGPFVLCALVALVALIVANFDAKWPCSSDKEGSSSDKQESEETPDVYGAQITPGEAEVIRELMLKLEPGSYDDAALARIINSAQHDPSSGRVRAMQYAGTIILFIVFLSYTTASTMIFRALRPCHKFDEDYHGSNQYMKDDYSTSCHSKRHEFIQIYALIMLFIYPIGVPLLTFVFLWRHRKTLNPDVDVNADLRGLGRDSAHKESGKSCTELSLRRTGLALRGKSSDAYEPLDDVQKNITEAKIKERDRRIEDMKTYDKLLAEGGDELSIQLFGRIDGEQFNKVKKEGRLPPRRRWFDRPELFAFIYQNYEPEYWWFECFDYIRRLMLTGILVVLKEGSAAQGLFGVLVALFGTQIYSWTRPFPEDAGDRLAETAQWSTFFTFLAALMILLNVEADSSFHREVFAVLLVAIQFMPLVIGAAVPLLNPKGAASIKANSLKKEHDATAGSVDTGDGHKRINDRVSSIREHDEVAKVTALMKAGSASFDAAKKVGSMVVDVAGAAKSIATTARAKMRRHGTATKHKGSPPYDEEHPGPPESH